MKERVVIASVFVLAAMVVLIGFAAPAVAPGPGQGPQHQDTYYVSTGGSNSNSGTSPNQAFLTISYALSVVPTNSTIIVEPGTYTTNTPILISQPVTLGTRGGSDGGQDHGSDPAGQGSGVYLVAPASETLAPGQPPAYFQLGGSSTPEVTTGNPVSYVTITGFNFEGAGIEVPGTGASHILVSGNSFTNLFTEAIGYHGNQMIPDNPYPLDNFIIIAGNSVTGVPPSEESYGIYTSGFWLENLQNSTIAQNTIEGTGYAGIILTGAAQGDEQNNTIEGNYISVIPQQGIQVAFGVNVTVTGNVVNFAGIGGIYSGVPMVGIDGKDAAISLFNPDQNNIVITHNTLENSFEGLGVAQAGVTFTPDAVGNGIVVSFNNIVGNTIGIYNGASSGAINGPNNWWGHNTPPTQGGSNGIVGEVNYEPIAQHPFHVPGPGPGQGSGFSDEQVILVSLKN